MNKTEKNKVTMYYSVNAVLFNFQQTIDSIAPFAGSVSSFRNYLNEILERAQEVAGTVGTTAAKNNTLDDMTEHTFHISSALHTLGRHTNNEEIKSVTKLSHSDFYHLRENELVQYCTKIHNLAQIYADALVQYTITAEMITTLRQLIATYRHYTDSEDICFAGSKAAREILFNLFADTDELLREDIDTMVELIKNDNSAFYNQYNAARTILDISSGPRVNTMISDAIIIDSMRVPATAL